MTSTRPRIAITSGEPAGIGPELCLRLDYDQFDAECVLIGDTEVFTQRARALQMPNTAGFRLDAITAEAAVIAGTLDPRNAAYVLKTLDRAIDGCLSGEFDAMVTCPVQKSVMNDAGIAFTGHTEYLAERTHSGQVVMLLAAPQLRVALATTHLPISQVAAALTVEGLIETLRCLQNGLVQQLGIDKPLILVAGLNPHAGEAGHLGSEEDEIIRPALAQLTAEGLHLEGPLPADTLFTPPYLARADAVFAMYHDQGLPVLKHLGFGRAVNITLGLPFIRTSVDHGTALDLAGTGQADCGSLAAAIQTALDMVKVRRS